MAATSPPKPAMRQDSRAMLRNVAEPRRRMGGSPSGTRTKQQANEQAFLPVISSPSQFIRIQPTRGRRSNAAADYDDRLRIFAGGQVCQMHHPAPPARPAEIRRTQLKMNFLRVAVQILSGNGARIHRVEQLADFAQVQLDLVRRIFSVCRAWLASINHGTGRMQAALH